MEGAVFLAGAELAALLPPEVRRLRDAAELAARDWPLLALTERGCAALAQAGRACRCGTLLVPGDRGGDVLRYVRAERAVTLGLDSRDSLTFSSLSGGRMLCVQRTLFRPGGGLVEPQELALPETGLDCEEALVLAGVELLLG